MRLEKNMDNNLGYDVLIATYNGEKFIEEQLQSIISQSVKPNRIFIRDDLSSDSTLKIISKYNYLDYVKIIPGTENIGYIKNFEYLISLAISPIIFFCDQDDFWDKDKAKLILQQFNISQSNVIFTDAYIVNSQLQGTQSLWESIGFSGNLPVTIDDYLYNGNVVTGATMACKLNFLKEIAPFPESVPHDFWIAVNSIYRNTLFPFDHKLIQYRQHANNTIGVNQTTGLTKFINKFLFRSVVKRKNDAFEKSRIYIHMFTKLKNNKSLDTNKFMTLFFVYTCTLPVIIDRISLKYFIIYLFKRPVLFYDFIVIRLFGLK